LPIEDGLGQQMIGALTDQLRGSFSAFAGPDGPTYELVFPKIGRARVVAPALSTVVEPVSSALH
jgi:two-component sensor histidine kinase